MSASDCNAVLFDLFGTLTLPFPNDGFRTSLEQMASVLGMTYQQFHDAWTQETVARRFTGVFGSLRNELAWICEHNGVEARTDSLDEAVRIRIDFTRGILAPRNDAVPTLRELRSRNIRTAVVSNCSFDVPDAWPSLPFAGESDAEIFSCSVGAKKPDPAIYRAACDALDVEPEECWFIGDGFGDELRGARELGMRPFLLLPPDESRPTSADWEGHAWDGEVLPSLGSALGCRL